MAVKEWVITLAPHNGHPTVVTVEAEDQLGALKIVEQDWFPLDGLHRIEVLAVDGSSRAPGGE